jgi:Ser-tRNA(Ala) deacylase AlaX
MTNLIYLQYPELSQYTAKVQNLKQTEKGQVITLDQTIFYTQGGGQPGDKGLISNNNSSFLISNTVFGADGEVWHLVSEQEGQIKIGEEVNLEIDTGFRLQNSRLHSAGHLFDLATQKLGLDWQPGKGHHFPEGSYVEYLVKNESNDLEILRLNLQAEFEKLVLASLDIQISFDNNQTYKDQPLRMVSFAGEASCPCGGTHASNTVELIGFKIRKLKYKNGVMRLSYGIET